MYFGCVLHPLYFSKVQIQRCHLFLIQKKIWSKRNLYFIRCWILEQFHLKKQNVRFLAETWKNSSKCFATKSLQAQKAKHKCKPIIRNINIKVHYNFRGHFETEMLPYMTTSYHMTKDLDLVLKSENPSLWEKQQHRPGPGDTLISSCTQYIKCPYVYVLGDLEHDPFHSWLHARLKTLTLI